jgi:hypothetical protein
VATLDPNGVPILDLSDRTQKKVDGHDGLLTGTVVFIDNPRPVGAAGPDVTW